MQAVTAVPDPVDDLRGEGEIGAIVLDWTPAPWETVVDHYAVYAAEDADVSINDDALLVKTVYPHVEHRGLGGEARRWVYRVVTVDAAGSRSEPTDTVSVISQESVTVSGTPLAVVGEFDGKSLELALAPDGYQRFSDTFPDGVDFRHGTDAPETAWSYLHPGPADGWADQSGHRFRLRFTVGEVPADDVDLALWLIDSHASNPGTAVLHVNGTTTERVRFRGGSTQGSTLGDSTVPDSPLRPSYIELPIAAELLVPGENILDVTKDDGSWIAYDAIGLFTRGAH